MEQVINWFVKTLKGDKSAQIEFVAGIEYIDNSSVYTLATSVDGKITDRQNFKTERERQIYIDNTMANANRLA